MKIEVLYVAGCPWRRAAVRLVRDVAAAQGVAAQVCEVLVRDQKMANELKFLGSPTIRVNGRDVAGEGPEDGTFALSCRLYPGSQQAGLPPAEWIRLAMMEAEKGEPR